MGLSSSDGAEPTTFFWLLLFLPGLGVSPVWGISGAGFMLLPWWLILCRQWSYKSGDGEMIYSLCLHGCQCLWKAETWQRETH